MSNDLALKCFASAREHYVSRRFELAQQEIEKYKQIVDYRKFDQFDRRTVSAPQISVIVVSHHAGPTLLNCLHSVLAQEGPSFELILVDNGGNEHVHDELTKLPLLFVKLPMNLLPSEGRNIGAHFARGELIVFLDDDAVMVQGYLKSGFTAMKDDKRMGLRGQALSKTPHKIAPKHYSLGQTPTQAEFNLEGNMLIRKTVLDAVGGFDALMFGHEGKELTQRCKRQFPDKVIQYRPELCIEHDFAETHLLEAKRGRQSLGKDYSNFLQSKNMNLGVSILIRAGDDLAAAEDFLVSLLKHNSHKEIEILLWANDLQRALEISRSYLTKLYFRVLPTSIDLNRIAKQARHKNLLIIDLPMRLKSDCLLQWVGAQKVDHSKALVCSKTHAEKFIDLAINTPISTLKELIHQNNERSNSSTTRFFKPTKEKQKINVEVNIKESEILEAKIGGQPLDEKDFIQRYGWFKPSSLPKNIPPLTNNSDNFRNSEIHRFSQFLPYKPTKGKRKSLFTIVAIVGERMQESLSFDADVAKFDLSIWETQLAAFPSFVLIESDPKVLQLEGETSFKKFLDACNLRGIPTVFWHTDAKEHCSMYLDIAKRVGFVGAVEQESVAYFQKHTKASVRLLEHAIQPAVHNAIREELPKPSYSNMRFFFDGWADLVEFRDHYSRFLQPLCDLGLHIFESKWQFMKNKLPETPQFIGNIHGAINYHERLNAIKLFDVCIMAMPSMKSTSALTLDALEAIASKRVVLFKSELELPMLSGLISRCSNDDEFIAKARRLIEYPTYRDECAHKAWRQVHSNHTFVNRLNTLAEWIGLKSRLEQFPSVASITVTKRPELLVTNAKKNYMQQAAQRKEWIIVLNTLDVNVADVEASLQDVPNVRIYQVSSDKNIGFCLNMAIGKLNSEYWAKMDDDDFYDKYYLSDQLIVTNCRDSDLMGKRPSFTYLEQENSIFFRHPQNWHFSDFVTTEKIPHMCGATFFGHKNIIEKVKFSESIRSAVDSSWYMECIDKGLAVIINDNYSFTIFRSSDKSKHTWRIEDDDIKKNSLFIGEGKAALVVNI